MYFELLKATSVRIFLLLLSFSVSSILSRYLQSIHVVSPFFSTSSYFVVVSFTRRSFSLSFGGSPLLSDLDVSTMSSAYCCFIMNGLMLYFV